MSLHASTRVFQIGVWGIPLVEGDGQFCLEDLIYMMVETWEVMLTIRTFLKAENIIL